jgi:hypothetical protein
MATGRISIPAKFVTKFMTHPRITDLHSPAGTRPIDLKAFRAAITETLANREFMQELVNAAIKQGQFQIK